MRLRVTVQLFNILFPFMTLILNTNKRRNYSVPWYAWQLVPGHLVGTNVTCRFIWDTLWMSVSLGVYIRHSTDVRVLQGIPGHLVDVSIFGCQSQDSPLMLKSVDVKYLPQTMFHSRKAHKHSPCAFRWVWAHSSVVKPLWLA